MAFKCKNLNLKKRKFFAENRNSMQNIVFKELTKKVKKDESVINFVPCKIHYEGQGNVNEYFNHKTKSIKGQIFNENIIIKIFIFD